MHTKINCSCSQLDNTGAVCQRAKEYVSKDEVILVYGYSRLVELFLKAVGAKRRFQVSLLQLLCDFFGFLF